MRTGDIRPSRSKIKRDANTTTHYEHNSRHCVHTELLMALTTAERNRRKRERKKREREEQRKRDEEAAKNEKELPSKPLEEEVEIEYVAEAIIPQASKSSNEGGAASNNEDASEDLQAVLRRFQERASVAVVTDDERGNSDQLGQEDGANDNNDNDADDDDEKKPLSKRKQRELSRPSVADLKRRVKRSDLVEAHDVTAADPDFLICLKGVPGTVPIPRHWGRKRKYLQGKRGIEKPPFQLPDFIIKTGITELRDAVQEDESKMSIKQKNRSRVAPKSGAIDVDYRTLHDAFFKYQTKPTNLTGFGDLYYEGKEFETRTDIKPGGELSATLREALGMTSESSPPPWLVNMQRYGPPPSYPNLKIPGLSAPLPNEKCQYGYHTGGWGKPPVDNFGRPLYGGNPFGKPGGEAEDPSNEGGLVTSDGKTILKKDWGTLPTGFYEDADEEEEESSDEEEESSDEEMEESDGEEKEEETTGASEEIPASSSAPAPSSAALDLRKQAGDETPFDGGPKQLYTVLEQTKASKDEQQGAVFTSEVAYVVPGGATAPEGAESVLSKAVPSNDSSKRKRQHDDDDDADLEKKFKF